MRQGTFELLMPESEELFVYERRLGEGRMLVACNFCDREVPFGVPAEYAGGTFMAHNYSNPGGGVLRPFECFALLVSNNSAQSLI